MRIAETRLGGAFLVDLERREDERGYFARTFCREEFERAGLTPVVEQCSTSFNQRRGTLRGLHFQLAPAAEHKLVRCTRGRIYDVIVDIRSDSPTACQWLAVELSEENARALYVPAGFAHGFQTLVDGAEVFYQISEPYRPDLARGIRWDDPVLQIRWPLPDPIVSPRDRALPGVAEALAAAAVAPSRDVVLWGATGQAKVLRECLKAMGWRIVAVFDNDARLRTSPFDGVPLFTGEAGFFRWREGRGAAAPPPHFLVAIGGDRGLDRLAIHEFLEREGLPPLTAVHPTAFVADNASLGAGSQVLAQSAVGVEAVLGRGCIVNTGATVDHECRLGDGVHVCPGAHLAGCVEVGACATIGTGAAVLPRVVIGPGAVVGAGAVVTADVPPHTVVVGNPARVLREARP